MAIAQKVSLGAIGWGAVTAALVARTFWRPARAVVADGFAEKCTGESACDPALTIASFRGSAPVYAVSPGRVVSVAAGVIRLASSREPVILSYEDPSLSPQVAVGDKVGIGQQIALASRVRFSVYVVARDAQGAHKFLPNEPASWLAARGLRISQKGRLGDSTSQKWCDGGRKLEVPEAVAKCGVRLPTPGAFMLLPVSVTTAGK